MRDWFNTLCKRKDKDPEAAARDTQLREKGFSPRAFMKRVAELEKIRNTQTDAAFQRALNGLTDTRPDADDPYFLRNLALKELHKRPRPLRPGEKIITPDTPAA